MLSVQVLSVACGCTQSKPFKGKAPSGKEASAKPRDENKKLMPRNGSSPKNFGMNSKTMNLQRKRSVYNSLAKHTLQHTEQSTKYHQTRKGDGL